MPFTGRYHLVRHWWLPTMTVGPPLVLDRRHRTLLPYRGGSEGRAEWAPRDERRAALRRWQRVRERLRAEPSPRHRLRLAERLASRDADCGRLAALFGKGDVFPLKLLWDQAVASTTLALSSNYVAGTSGNAVACRHWCPPGGKTLNNVYYFISSFTGTAANVTDINLELRPEASTGASTPNTGSLTESKTDNPSSTTGWHNVSGWTSSLSALARNFVIVGDANGNGTDFATVNSRAQAEDNTVGSSILCLYVAATTTGGWASGNTTSSAPASVVLAFSGGTVCGNPLTTATAPASDTNRRGLRITSSGLIAAVPVFGMLWTNASGSISGMEIYNNANNPGTSPDQTSTDILYGTGGNRQGCLTSGGSPYTLQAGTAYRLVATYSASVTSGPQRMDIGAGSDANLKKAMPGGGEFYYGRANGTTDWSNDLTDSLPAVGLLVDGQVASSGGQNRALLPSGVSALG